MEKGIWVHFNGGKIHINEVGTLDSYGDVWMCRGGISNILSLAKVKKSYPMTLQEGKFTVSCGDGIHILQDQENLLFILDVQEWKMFKDMVMVKTVAKKSREILMWVPRRSRADQMGLRYDGVSLNYSFQEYGPLHANL